MIYEMAGHWFILFDEEDEPFGPYASERRAREMLEEFMSDMAIIAVD